MRWFYIATISLFAVATLLFAVQNMQSATISFLTFSLQAPLALVAVVSYLLGMGTGTSLFALLRRSIEAARTRPG